MKQFKFKIRGSQYNVDIQDVNGKEVEVEVNGTHYLVTIDREVKQSKTPTIVRKKLPKQEKKPIGTGGSLKTIKAPLPGNIFKLNVKEGDKVKKGETLVILEAMKMENNILAEFDGVVNSVKIKEGDAVLQNDVLIELN